MKTSQSFTFYPADFLLGTALLSAAEVGAYIRLLCYQWQEGELPKDENLLARLALCDVTDIRAILPKFRETSDGKLKNRRLEEVRKSLSAYKKSRSENGKKGGRPPKAQGNHMVSPCFNGAKHSESFPSPSPSPSPSPFPSPVPETKKPLPLPATAPQRLGAGEDSSDALTLAAEPEPLPQKPAKNLPTSEQAKRIATMFKRRLSTPWQSREVSALRNLGTIEEADLAAVEAYYSAHWPPDRNKNVLRHDLGTLLNNFRGEVDRAQAWQRKNAPVAADAPKRNFWAGSALENRPTHQTQTPP